MFIGILGPPHSVHIQLWANKLYSEGHRVVILFFSGDDKNREINPLWYENLVDGITIHVLGKRPSIPLLRQLEYRWEMNLLIKFKGWRVRALRNFISERQIDLIFAHKLDYYSYIASGLNNVPVIAHPWGTEVFANVNKSIESRFKYTLKNVDAVICTSKKMAQILLELYSETKLHEISWGVDSQTFTPLVGKERDDILQSFGLNKTKRTIVFPRGLGKIYRGELVTKLVKNLLIQGTSNVILIDSGSGPHTLIEELKLLEIAHSSLKFFDRFIAPAKFAEILGVSDICVSIPVTDQRSSTVLQALSCGNFLILSDLGSFEDLFQLDGVEIASTSSLEQLEDQILSLIEDPNRLESAKQLNREYALQNEDEQRQLRKVMNVFMKAIGS